MEEAGDECAGAGEWVEYVDAFVGEGGSVEVFLEEVVDGSVDEVDDFDRCVDDPERFDGLGERSFEELLVQLGDDLLACLLYTSPSPRDRTRSRMPSSACKKNIENTSNSSELHLTQIQKTIQ